MVIHDKAFFTKAKSETAFLSLMKMKAAGGGREKMPDWDHSPLQPLLAGGWYILVMPPMVLNELAEYASHLVSWVLGCNPYNICMMYGYGQNNVPYMSSMFGHGSGRGGISNGITGRRKMVMDRVLISKWKIMEMNGVGVSNGSLIQDGFFRQYLQCRLINSVMIKNEG